MTTPDDNPVAIQVDPLPEKTLRVPIVGTTPLIVHRFSEKAKRQMLDTQQGRKSVKQHRDPEAEYEAAFYRLKDGRYGFPVLAFKAATIGAARFYDKSVTMVALRQAMFFRGEPSEDQSVQLAAIDGEPEMREDTVRVGRGGSDLRYRPMFPEWSTTLEVSLIASMLDQQSLVSLIDAGGLGVGVGDWRPERGGDFGTYRVDASRNIEIVS